MKQQTNVRITTPCHENWDAMTPAEGGKFCASCSKQVIDFTLMSDAQVLKFLTSHSSGLCGRFDAGQLERPLTEPLVSKRKSWYLALALPFSLLLQKSFGQKGERTMGTPAMTVQKATELKDVIVGEIVLPPVAPEWVMVHGILKDETGKPVENASVMVKGTRYGGITDSTGRFSVRMRREEDPVALEASLVGYQSVEKKVDLANADEEQVLIITAKETMLKDVVVTSPGLIRCSRTTGLFSTYHIMTSAEKRDSAVRKILRLNPFIIYPNPARSGGAINLTFKKTGAYEVQLLNNASALLKTEQVQAGHDGTPVPFHLPQLAVGIYYLRLISGDKKQSYLEKILVN